MDYKEMKPQDVKDLEIEHVDELLEQFEYARLCDKIGCQIVSEFDFKGSKNEVWEQLLGYREFIEDFVFDEAFINDLIVRKNRLDAFEVKFDATKKEVHDAVKEFMITKDMMLLPKLLKRRKQVQTRNPSVLSEKAMNCCMK